MHAWHKAMYGAPPAAPGQSRWGGVGWPMDRQGAAPDPADRSGQVPPLARFVVAGGGAESRAGGMGPGPSPGRGALAPASSPGAIPQEVEAFLARNFVDREAAAQLRRLTPEQQHRVMDYGDVDRQRNPTGQLMLNIQRVLEDLVFGEEHNIVRSVRPTTHDGDLRLFLTAGAPELKRTSGRWYYEVLLGRHLDNPSAGGIQVGWVSELFEAGDYTGHGVGADEHGWAMDGRRHLWWHGGPSKVKWPCTWQPGDTVGCAVDIEAGQMIYIQNGEFVLAVPFEKPEGFAIFPAISARGEFTFGFTSAIFKHTPPQGGFEPLMEDDYAATAYGSRGAFARPKGGVESPPASPREKGKKIYKDCPFQQSVVDQVVFGRDMDMSGDTQFDESYMAMYKDRHGKMSSHTDFNKLDIKAQEGLRRFGNTPEQQSVVDQVVFGRDMDASGETQYDDDFLKMFDGAAGKLSVDRGSISDKPKPIGRRHVDVAARQRWLQDGPDTRAQDFERGFSASEDFARSRAPGSFRRY